MKPTITGGKQIGETSGGFQNLFFWNGEFDARLADWSEGPLDRRNLPAEICSSGLKK